MTLASEHERSRKSIGDTDFFRFYDQTLTQIDPEHALLVADFGHGSDAPIALDYRGDRNDPPVIGLKWDNSRPLPSVTPAECRVHIVDKMSMLR